MKLTTIQVDDATKKKLESKKVHPRESYDSVLKRMLEEEITPSLEEMFIKGDSIKQKKIYSTNEIVGISHELRRRHG